MNKNLLHFQYYRLSSIYRKLKLRFDKALKENRFKDYSLHKQRQLISRLEKLRARLASLQQLLKLSGSALALGLILNSEEVQAQASVPAGSEFQVNTFTIGNQILSSVAMDSDGDFVVTWLSSGQDGDNWGVYAQRYNASGVEQGAEFRVNTYTTSHQMYPSIAMDSDGDFVVTWSSLDQDGSYYGIYAQRYDASGAAQGSEFKVNTYTTNNQIKPSIAMDSDGDFVIAWSSHGQDGDNYGIYAQRYNASGIAQGGEFQVNTFTTSYQFYSSVAMDSDGDFVITWLSFDQDGEYAGVYAQRYNASGVAQGSEFKVNTSTLLDQAELGPSIAMDSDGDFVIAWTSYLSGSDVGNFARRYDASGIAQGSEFQVNTYTNGYELDLSSAMVAMDSDGDFVITWHRYYEVGNYSVYAQRYNASGVAQGSEFQVNTNTIGHRGFPSVAMDSDGDFVITWLSYGQDGGDGGIYAQRYTQTITGLSNAYANSKVNIYPNPSSGEFRIECDNLSLEGFKLSLTNVLGEEVYTNEFTEQISLQNFPKGIYMLKLENEKGVIVKQIVIQ